MIYKKQFIVNECIAISISNIETTVLNTIENQHHDGFRDLWHGSKDNLSEIKCTCCPIRNPQHLHKFL